MKFTQNDIGKQVTGKAPNESPVLGKIQTVDYTRTYPVYVITDAGILQCFTDDEVEFYPPKEKHIAFHVDQRVRVIDPGSNDHGKMGVITSIAAGGPFPVNVSFDKRGSHCYAYSELVAECESTSDTCDECQGTGEVELLTSFVPCSRCKP